MNCWETGSITCSVTKSSLRNNKTDLSLFNPIELSLFDLFILCLVIYCPIFFLLSVTCWNNNIALLVTATIKILNQFLFGKFWWRRWCSWQLFASKAFWLSLGCTFIFTQSVNHNKSQKINPINFGTKI